MITEEYKQAMESGIYTFAKTLLTVEKMKQTVIVEEKKDSATEGAKNEN